jgi:AcrR family transcriptional regulator
VEAKVDGRRARGMRTREAIVESLMALVDAGDVNTTAQRIADRAGVSVRSLYQHFDDVDGLFGEAGHRLADWVAVEAVDIDTSKPLEERIVVYTDSRAAVLERILPFHRAARVLAPSSESMRNWRTEMMEQSRVRLEKAFEPELSSLPLDERDVVLAALDVLNTWQSWDQLRQSHDVDTTRRVVSSAFRALLATPPRFLNGRARR